MAIAEMKEQFTLEDDKLYTSAQMRSYLGISPATQYRLHQKGELVGKKVGCEWRYPGWYLRQISQPIDVERKHVS